MKNKPLLAIFLVVFIDLIGFGMVVPILPYYAKQLGASPSTLGWLMMCYSGMQFLFSPFWGKLSDRIGRRPVLLTCILGLATSMIFLGMAKSLAGLFAARLLTGFFGANISTAAAYIADITKPEERSKGMGMIGAAFGLGFLFGPAFGGLLSKWGYGTSGFVAGTLSALNFFFALAVIKEPNLSEEEREEHRHRPSGNAILATLKEPRTGLLVIVFFIVTLGMAQLETTFGLFLLDRFNLDAKHAGFILAFIALMMAFVQGGGIGKLVAKYGEVKLIMLGTIAMTMAMIGSGLSGAIWIFIIFCSLQGLGYGITNPTLQGLMSKMSSKKTQGATMGVYQSAGSLGRVIGPISAGYLFEHAGPAFPFYVASILFGISFVIITIKNSVWFE